MVHGDPQQRSARLAEVTEILKRETRPEDRDLLLSLAPIFFAGMPARLALDLPPGAVAARLLAHFRFVVRDMPPAPQLYKGLPGIHVSVFNPSEDEARALGGGAGLPLETTILQTHTPDAPFIFDSLKNYLQKQGLRVFSAIHPIFTVRRQWERIVARRRTCRRRAAGSASATSGSRRRLEGAAPADRARGLLPAQDRVPGRRRLQGHGPGLPGARAADPRAAGATRARLAAARAFLDWLLDDNYVFMGTVSLRHAAPTGLPARIDETRARRLHGPDAAAGGLPGCRRARGDAPQAPADDDRVIDLDFCANASAIYHLEPIEDLTVREWGEDGKLEGADPPPRPVRQAAPSPSARTDIPMLKEKQDAPPRALRGHRRARTSGARPGPSSTTSRRRELFYADAADLERIIQRIVHVAGDDEIAVEGRKGAGYEALYVAFSRLRYALPDRGRRCGGRFAGAFGPVLFGTSADCGTVTLLIFYFDSTQLEHPVDLEEARRADASRASPTWEDRVAAALEKEFGEREGRRLFRSYVRPRVAQRPLPRGDGARAGPRRPRQLEALESRLEVRVVPKTAETASVQLCSRARPST